MKQDIAVKWVEALRSGKYQQARSRLYDGEGYCCLGVLCEVMGHKFTKQPNGSFSIAGSDSVLPDVVEEAAGMNSRNGHSRKIILYGPSNARHSNLLSEANDDGATFAQIADHIENNYKDL